MAAGCGGDDPTEPRDVRPVEPVQPTERTPAATDQDAPTRGLPCEEQPGALRLCGAATDNYKASFNEDPQAPELRTWLAVHELELDGQRYQAAPGQELVQETVELVAVEADAEPRTVRLAVRAVDGPAGTLQFRIGPQRGLWGPLLQLADRERLKEQPVVVELSVASPADAAGPTLRVTYEHDPQLADVPADHLEHGGPGGRWHVDGMPTGTNLELGWE